MTGWFAKEGLSDKMRSFRFGDILLSVNGEVNNNILFIDSGYVEITDSEFIRTTQKNLDDIISKQLFSREELVSMLELYDRIVKE